MTRQRRISTYLDALAAGRRPGSMRAEPEDVELLRTAIALRADRPGDAVPDQQFVSDLYQDLAREAAAPVVPIDRPTRRHRGRVALASVAAGLVLVGGTVVATETLGQGTLAPAAVQAPRGSQLRTGTFENADNRATGQIVAYEGNPSWVFMKVDVPNYDGKIRCTLQSNGGATVATGEFELHAGMGVWSKTLRMNASQLRGARLVTSTGAVVAVATLA